MSVMFEILEGLERKSDPAKGFAAKAWIQDMPVAEPACEPSAPGRGSVPSVLNKLSKAMVRPAQNRPLLDMRFGSEPRISSAIRSARSACESATLWASARLCTRRRAS